MATATFPDPDRRGTGIIFDNQAGWLRGRLLACAAMIAVTACSNSVPTSPTGNRYAAHSPDGSMPVATAPTTAAPPSTKRPSALVLPHFELPRLGPPGDQPIGLKFPAAPQSFQSLVVPSGRRSSVSLTFDDGPDLATPQILGLLEHAHVTATFCVVGKQVQQFPALINREVRDHMSLCDHTRDHALGMPSRDRAFVRAEIRDGLAAMQRATNGAHVPFYRQPYGQWSPTIVREAMALELQPLRWTTDPRDWSAPGAVAIAQRVLLRLQSNGIILLHDGGGDRSQTVAAVRWLLPALAAAGWTFTAPHAQGLTLNEAGRPE